jgi:hypothetical protein
MHTCSEGSVLTAATLLVIHGSATSSSLHIYIYLTHSPVGMAVR